MHAESRTQKSIRNILISLSCYALIMMLQLMCRRVFVVQLPDDYLGLNGLFSNIISMLCLSELGIGTAMAYSLYKPIVENDKNRIYGLMCFYKKIYRYVSAFILIFGMVLSFFLPFLFPEVIEISFFRAYFLLYVINASFSYLCAYKRTLIIADQKEYISTIVTTAVSIMLRFMQIGILSYTSSFAGYIATQTFATFVENIFVSYIANRYYPYLHKKEKIQIPIEEISNIKKNIMAMFGHKLANVVVNATDSVIITRVLGLSATALFSNYDLILVNLRAVFMRIFNAINASVGNMIASEDKNRSEEILNVLIFCAFYIQSIFAVGLFVLFQPFIRMWVGEKFLLPKVSMTIFVAYFYISNMRMPVMTYRNATGTFWNDRYKPYFESAVNLIVSIPLTYLMGIGGVKLGTIVSTLTVSFWVEAYVLYKYYFNKSAKKYLFKQGSLMLLTAFYCVLCNALCNGISSNSVSAFFIKMFICIFVPSMISLAIFYKSLEFRTLKELLIKLYTRNKNKRLNR